MNFAFIPQLNVQFGANVAVGSPGATQTLVQLQGNNAAVTQVIL
jgi:hypothetical protein